MTFAGALVVGPDDVLVVLGCDGEVRHGPLEAIAPMLLGDERLSGGRWVVWSAESVASLLRRWPPRRLWDIAEVHRLRHGGLRADPGWVWALEQGLDPHRLPAGPAGDLFDLLAEEDDPADEPGALGVTTSDAQRAALAADATGGLIAQALTSGGYLRPEVARSAAPAATPVGGPGPASDLAGLVGLAAAALAVAQTQRAALQAHGPRHVTVAQSESAAALLCVELQSSGLPIDRPALEGLINRAAGPRPANLEDEVAARAARDRGVIDLVPGMGAVDLRNPAQVGRLLSRVGIEVESTRKWVLEEHRARHPVVPALLAWRKAERIATTHGWRWLAEHVGPDDRLRGRWQACDGAAGRMTAQAGLHNLPAELRSAVAAEPGHVLVRADLGQIEPRVLAAVSGDPALIAATSEADLYAPVAARLGVPREVAKVAMLAAMYGQRSGAAGEALRGMERTFPVAMRALTQAQSRGREGLPVQTLGGRVVATEFGGRPDVADPEAADRGRAAAQGRFARNALIQGSAAELFKLWAVTVRAGGGALGGQIVLCLHDELILHVPREQAGRVVDLLHRGLSEAAGRYLGPDGPAVRFVAEVDIRDRWAPLPGG